MAPTFFAALVCAAGLVGGGTRAIYLQMLFCLFGGTAALLLTALGGATITPAVLFLPFLMLRAWQEREGGEWLRRVSKAGFWLGVLALWGLLGAYFLPRLFQGQVEILTIDRNALDRGAVIYPLGPVSGNITQTAYAIGGVCTFFAMRGLLSRPERLGHFRDAVLLLAALNIGAALLNLAEYHLGFPSLLGYVRTAGYGINDAYESGGLLRIQGTFPETSAFSGFTLPLFAFCFSLWLGGVRPYRSGTLAALSLGLLLASTSGTAYTGLVGYFACVSLALSWRAYSEGRLPRLSTFVIGGCFVLLAAGAAFMFELSVAQRVAEFFDHAVMRKMDSASGVERGAWNRQAWSNFIDTYGIGVGLGSARASSFPLVLLSNVGLTGTLLFLAFLKQAFVGDGQAVDATSRASRQAMLACLIGATVSATVFDLGAAFFAFAAASTVGKRQPCLAEQDAMAGRKFARAH